MQLRHLVLAFFGILFSSLYGQNPFETTFDVRDPMTKSYNRISASYELGFYKHYLAKDAEHIHGFGIGYTHGFSLSKTAPVFIEAGVTGLWGFDRQEYPEILLFELVPSHDILAYPGTLKQSGNLFSISLPVSLAYKFGIGKEFCIEPFMGISARFNLLADYTHKLHCDSEEGQAILDHLSPSEFHDKTGAWPFLTMFDEDKLGEEVWRRFQFRLHIGVNAQFRHINLGIAYNIGHGPKISRTTRSSFLNVSVGYNFCVY